MRRAWRVWAKAIGPKPEGMSDGEADLVALVRTVVFGIPAFCIIANCGRTFGLW